MNDQYLDELFRKKLEGIEIPPPPTAWDKISDGLARKGKKRRMAIAWILTSAAVIIFALAAGWFFINEPGQELPVASNQQINETDARMPVQPPARELVFEDSGVVNKIDVFIEEKRHDIPEGEKASSSNTLVDETIRNRNIGFRLLALASQLLPDTQAKEGLHDIAVQETVSADKLTSYEESLIAINRSLMESRKKESQSWEVGVKVSPGYGSQRASHDAAYASSMTYSNTSGRADLSGGISATFKPGKKWSVEAGVYYSRNGQSSDNSIFAASPEQDFSAAPASYFNTPVKLKRGQIAMNSTAGVIEFSKTPVNAELSATLDNSYSTSSSLLVDGEFSQVFDFIEIPFFFRYTLVDSKFDFHLLGGLSANFLAGNNVYMSGSYGRENVGKTADISVVNYSGTLGAGIEYDLGKHFSFSIEPRLNYYLNSINKNNAVNYHPYRIGIYTGVNYSF